MATSTITALGAGSGVDVKALAQSLVDAEKTPRKDAIDKKITKSEGGISGYGALKFVLSDLKSAFEGLKDASVLGKIAPKISQPGSFTATIKPGAPTSGHSIVVRSLAQSQKSVSDGFSSATQSLCASDLQLNLSIGPVGSQSNHPIQISAANATPNGIVAAINSSNLGISAQLLKTNDSLKPYKIVLSGEAGLENQFSVSTSSTSSIDASLKFDTTARIATNADLSIDGVDVSSKSNHIEGAIPNVTLDLLAVTSKDNLGNFSPATLDLSRDASIARPKVEALVRAFNDVNSMLNVVSDPKSTVETYGATLVGNSTVSYIRNQIRSIVTTFKAPNATGGIEALRDIGVSIDRNGQLSVDNNKLDSALQSNFDQVVTMLTGNKDGVSATSPIVGGVATESFKKLSSLLSNQSPLVTQTNNLSKKVSDYKLELEKLDARMTSLLERYNKQFSAMESMVNGTKSLQTSLKSTFDGMMSTYTNN